MAFLKPIQSVLAFLTILPVGKQNQDIYYIAKNMYLFPAAGLVIGSIVGAMALGISDFLHPLLTGFLITGVLVILTGVHHTDALADFADGLMAKGGKEVKHKAMLDPAVGSAGVATLVMYFAGMIIVFNIGFGSNLAIFTSIITAEVIAKYVMVLLANRGISAWEGFSSPFIAAMKDRYKMIAATGIMVAIVWFASSYAGFIALIISLMLAQLLKYISSKSFGGVSGDVLGASNEITRLSSFVVLSSLSSMPQVKWIF
ncbi:MAG: adenosylcobinamide-GDP ribazoletransferase [Thermoproteota archaeon]|nr:adenosylcobinamide-GDP ribazoletransferase [Thermoproteota archaeon]